MQQTSILERIGVLQYTLRQLKGELAKADAPARAAYNASLDDLPNWQILAWEELTEAERNTWRKQYQE